MVLRFLVQVAITLLNLFVAILALECFLKFKDLIYLGIFIVTGAATIIALVLLFTSILKSK